MRIVKYDIENFKGIACMTDFYKRLGFYEDIGKTIIEVGQIHMEKGNCEKLKDYIFQTLCKSKKFNFLKDEKILNIAAMDWLQFSPVSDKNMPKDEMFRL